MSKHRGYSPRKHLAWVGAACAIAGALAPGHGFAYGASVQVTDYYGGPDHAALVGRRVDGRCPRNPTPVDWGGTSDFPVTYALRCAGGPIEP